SLCALSLHDALPISFRISLLLMGVLPGWFAARVAGLAGFFEKGTHRLVAVDVRDGARQERRDRDDLEVARRPLPRRYGIGQEDRSEEHTSELQSLAY